ncbi:QWRF motif-containing protein 2 [Pyrus ussuriensis x Pyrus communis]|uniref:QWRF motif-containing protein 2 n=1 Tax=Pyrus ussuriensis x Pyrus communis TaxID=2448454 RepID=A0A5N5H010_9ROSA|nr:QWRF motif-containing protein 2 [Pyrus ussuriensis x Pyrus communis]
MVPAVSTTLNPKAASQGGGHPQNGTVRPPLLPSESDNGVAVPRRLKAREVTSRYMSSSSSSSSSTCSNSRRCPSPLPSRTGGSTAATPLSQSVKRSQSVERRRVVTPRPNSLDLRIGNGGAGGGGMSAAQKLLFTSTRSLSVSFQGESYSLQVSKAKPAPSPNTRKGTPERRKVTTPFRADQSENSKPTEQQLWPARLRQPNSMSRSLDCTDERKRVSGSGANVVRALQNSMVNDVDGRLRSNSCNLGSVKATEPVDDGNSATTQSEPVACSDSDSVSSGSTNSGPHELGNVGGGGTNGYGGVEQGPRPRGIVVPARFWQETNNRLRRQSESNKGNATKNMGSPKQIESNRLSMDSPVSSPRGVVNSRGQLSPIRGAARPASPSKLSRSLVPSSPMRGVSPSRVRNGVVATPSSSLSNMPSVLSFAADVRRGKVGENRIVDAHVVRLLHNRLLQWRFVNARANAALAAQRSNAERSLYNAWVTSSRLRESVRQKRIELHLLRQHLKLTSILKGQMTYLEELSLMDQDYSDSLSGAIEALKASTLRLPVVGVARADVYNVKDAISSAVDVMQAMASSICLLLSKVADVNFLVAELANVTAKEHALLGQCRDLLSTVAAMQVEECSLRTHILQRKRVPDSLTKV